MDVVSLQPAALPSRTASTGQVATLRRRVRASDELIRVLAELSFGIRTDDFTPITTAPTRAAHG